MHSPLLLCCVSLPPSLPPSPPSLPSLLPSLPHPLSLLLPFYFAFPIFSLLPPNFAFPTLALYVLFPTSSPLQSAAIGDLAHLVNFEGTDTIAGIVAAR